MSERLTIGIIGGGGRESALVDAHTKDSRVERVLAIPGNDLMQRVSHGKPVTTFQKLTTTSIEGILRACRDERVSFVEVAQDNALACGLVDALQAENIPTFGPTKEASQIEWDKHYARDFGERHGLPQPSYAVFRSEEQATAFLRSQPDQGWVIKACGLAQGKGVIVADTREKALAAVSRMKEFGNAGATFLIEERLYGEEFSAFAISDGSTYRILGTAQDHKRLFDGDSGPNTGGMGCSSPPLVFTGSLLHQVDQVFATAFEGLRREGRPYTGILYLGGMIVEREGEKKVFVIEFNARWGDPEAQVILPGLSEYASLTQAAVEGRIRDVHIRTIAKARVAVAGAARGYPGDISDVTGKRIYGLDEAMARDGVTVYGAGVRAERGRQYASGGRLFHIVGSGRNVIEARQHAYGALTRIHIEGNSLHYRTDIGWRDVERLRRGE